MITVYALTLFLSALLLFMAEPMFARMLLPRLGGSPAVWNTSVLFYQATALAGYLYAHVSTTRLGVRRQAALHLGLIALPFLVLPVRVPAGWAPPAEGSPIAPLLALMLVRVALPFAVVSATAPMLQKWLAAGRPAQPDPYRLYVASNLGSLAATLAYPFVVEPYLSLGQQSGLWLAGYALLATLIVACAVLLWRAPGVKRAIRNGPRRARSMGAAPLGVRRTLRWLVLAAVPSSLMLSVTAYLSASVAPFPLLWLLPLAIYLLTYAVAFAGRSLPTAWARAAQVVALVTLAMVINSGLSRPLGLVVALHLAAFLVVAMVCHGELARDRPPPEHLTAFYLWLTVGGALGGAFNALLAPVLFNSVLEYPLGLVVAGLLLPSIKAAPRRAVNWVDLVLPAGLALGGTLVVAATPSWGPTPVRALLLAGPAILCFTFSSRPVRFGLTLGAMLLIGALYITPPYAVQHAERTFFGTHSVELDEARQCLVLLHGGTVHGRQSLDPARAHEPLAYYHREGPIGEVFASLAEAPSRRVAVVGLGTGSLAAYARPGDEWTFYEIDPAVVRLAAGGRYFTFLRDCAPQATVVLGDARLSLAGAGPAAYDLIVLDAYNAESIPLHLLTREAMALYLDRLAPGGVLAFHISNPYLDLKPVLAGLAEDAGLAARVRSDLTIGEEDWAEGRSPSEWVVVARDVADLGSLAGDARWAPLPASPGRPWSDDYCSLAGVLRWR